MMSIEELYKIYIENNQLVYTDSRNPMEGGLFFALSGDNFNGNKFASDALIKGASFAVIDEGSFKGDKTILVNSVIETLQELSNFHREQVNPKVIGLTGTNGKTTTKELIASVLKQKYKIHFTKGNFNNHIGVPLTLLEMPLDTEIAVIEMGASGKGEIAKLCEIANPDIGLITNIGEAHIEGFGSFKGVQEAKSELYLYLENNNGIAFINKNDNLLMGLAPKCEHWYYLEDTELNKTEFHFVYNLIEEIPSIRLELLFNKEKLSIKSSLFGFYNFENIMVALSLGQYFGLSKEQLKNGIKSYISSNNRSQILTINSNKIILDAYNANPSSMYASLKSIVSFSKDEKWAILGDMKELGHIKKEAHQKVVDYLEEMPFAKIFLIGIDFANTKTKQDRFYYYDDIYSLKKDLNLSKIKNKLIFIKGSRSMHLEDVLI